MHGGRRIHQLNELRAEAKSAVAKECGVGTGMVQRIAREMARGKPPFRRRKRSRIKTRWRRLPAVVPALGAGAVYLMGSRGDWNKTKSVVCEQQDAVAIYFNSTGALVIRQQADWPHQEDDSIIIIAEHNIDHFLDRLTDICGMPSFGRPP
jgi:hypothetical protein